MSLISGFSGDSVSVDAVSSSFSDGSGSLSLFSDVTSQTFDLMNLVDTISTEIQFLFSVNAVMVRTKYTQVLKFQNLSDPSSYTFYTKLYLVLKFQNFVILKLVLKFQNFVYLVLKFQNFVYLVLKFQNFVYLVLKFQNFVYLVLKFQNFV